jgi:hypothetical protein
MTDDCFIQAMLAVAASSTGVLAMSSLLAKKPLGPEVWYQLHFGRDVDEAAVTNFLRSLAADRRHYCIAFEVVGTAGTVHFRLGVPAALATEITTRLQSFVPSVASQLVGAHSIGVPTRAWRIGLTSTMQPLRTDQSGSIARAILSALTSTGKDETIILQWLLGPRRARSKVRAGQRPAESWGQLLKTAAIGEAPLDHDERRGINEKLSEPGFRSLGRLAVRASTPAGEQALALRLLAALRMSESLNVRITIDGEKVDGIVRAVPPRKWPLPLNVLELTTLLGWPLGNGPLPGMNRTGSQLLRPEASVTGSDRIIGMSGFHGDSRSVVLPITAPSRAWPDRCW